MKKTKGVLIVVGFLIIAIGVFALVGLSNKSSEVNNKEQNEIPIEQQVRNELTYYDDWVEITEKDYHFKIDSSLCTGYLGGIVDYFNALPKEYQQHIKDNVIVYIQLKKINNYLGYGFPESYPIIVDNELSTMYDIDNKIMYLCLNQSTTKNVSRMITHLIAHYVWNAEMDEVEKLKIEDMYNSEESFTNLWELTNIELYNKNVEEYYCESISIKQIKNLEK